MHTTQSASLILAIVVLSAVAPAQSRVVNRDHLWKQRCDSAGITYPPSGGIAFVAWKEQKLLEVWGRMRGEPYVLLHVYDVCRQSGTIGPKRMQGDAQVPEGMYMVTRFNPVSAFHLSLGINYPNPGDRRQATGYPAGGDIYIHGNCVSAGCLAMTDRCIEEIYWIAHRVRRTTIPVLMFPTNDASRWSQLLGDSTAARHPSLHRFWTSLKPLHDAWLTERLVPAHAFDDEGLYLLQPRRRR